MPTKLITQIKRQEMEVLEAIQQRHSVRQYTTQVVEEEKLQTILAAAAAAPVGMGQYKTMHLTVVQQPEILAKLAEAGKAAFGRDLTYGAPTLIIVSATPSEQVPGMEKYSSATILENMMLAATSEGLGSVFLLAVAAIASQSEELRQLLQIPDGQLPTAAMALGYEASTPRQTKHEIAVTRL